MRSKNCRVGQAILVIALLALPASALTISLDYSDGDIPAGVQTAFNYAADLWDTTWIASDAASGAGSAEDTYTINVHWDPLRKGVLGSASTPQWNYNSGPNSTYYYPESQFKVFFDVDLPTMTGGDITLSSKFTWYTGTDGITPGGQYDTVSVALHEIGHQMGMTGSYSSSNDRWGFYNGTADAWRLSNWDSFLEDEDGDTPVPGVAGSAFNETDNPVYFTGALAMAAYGARVPIYAPSSYAAGSSLAHMNEAQFSSLLMSYSIGTAESVHLLSSVEWAMYQDMGWTMTPEPSTAILAVLGLAAAVRVRRRRKQNGGDGSV